MLCKHSRGVRPRLAQRYTILLYTLAMIIVSLRQVKEHVGYGTHSRYYR